MSRKRRLEAADVGTVDAVGGGSLYDFLPPPDPQKEARLTAAAEAKAEPPLPPEDKTRVIFLDIDGVMLPAGYTERVMVDGELVPVLPNVQDPGFSPVALSALRMVFQQTGASVVLSSEWRRTEDLKNSVGMALRTRGLPQLRGCTTKALKPRPECLEAHEVIAFAERRAREIGDWLRQHPEVLSWVVLDDVNFTWADGVRARGTPLIRHRSVRTDAQTCLNDQDARQAIGILLSPPALTDEQERGIERRARRKLEAAFTNLRPGAAKQAPAANEGAMPPKRPPRRPLPV